MSQTDRPLPLTGLRDRLRAAAEVLDVEVPDPSEDSAIEAADLLAGLVQVAVGGREPGAVWLLHVALTASFPGSHEVARARRAFELRTPGQAEEWLLDEWYPAARHNPLAAWPMEIVRDAVVLDVSHTARHDLHTGIQRVVRSASPYWAELGELVPVAWSDGFRGYRTLTAVERRRVFQWNEHQADGHALPASTVGATIPDDDTPALVVPWNCTVVLAESLEAGSCDRLAALADCSGSRLAAIGYDLIPAVSADMVPVGLSDQFLKYLTVIKHTSRVAAISKAAAVEFRGFGEMLANQGLPGPDVHVCELPAPPMPPEPVDIPSGRPRVVMVGSFEPRKNHLSVLFAAERLWREGHDFELHLVGGMSWVHDIHDEIDRLATLGHPVHKHLAISEEALDEQYRSARFSVFASVHEGYGLPVVESLAVGTPAVIGDVGSVGEIGAAGGCLLVDPRDDDSLHEGMRRLLTDDDLLRELHGEIAARPTTTWSDYASASWQALVGAAP
ncbi:MAG TPA: glycosyltransferase [Acidimicrobiales bacterium]|jgi:glycosyltransferase involved in cell wall biosynthesis|nr:glycosyltransferase [Acidimicrobiales bacterium]